VVIPFGIIGVVCLVTLVEKHMSGTIILFSIGMVVIFVGKVSARWIGALIAVGIVGAVVMITSVGYTSDRIMAWLDPFKYELDEGWQIVQSLYAISSGGLFGVGLGNSTQKHMYLPEPQNDYIFAIICEELGFIGALVMFLMFGILIWRGIIVSRRAPDSFSRLVAIGITGKVAIQTILNVFVVTNLFPPTGISLPFFSYGGTALIFLLCEMGILLSISRYSYHNKV
jgi:cell division protein FtsW